MGTHDDRDPLMGDRTYQNTLGQVSLELEEFHALEANIESHTTATSTLLQSTEQTQDEQYDQEGQLAAWTPFWIRNVTLISFVSLFILLSIGLSLTLYFSQKNHGLFEANEDFIYPWKFGPTAIITIISLLWSRVELQMLRYTPWAVAQQSGRERPIDYDLDYTQMLLPMALVRSLKEKHLMVFFFLIISVILKVQIVLASSLLQLYPLKVSNIAGVQVLDSFSNASGNYTHTAYYNARAAQKFDITDPFGVTDTFAYQTFTRGTVDKPLKVTVDAHLMDIKCLELESCSSTKIPHDDEEFEDEDEINEEAYYKMDLHFQGCNTSFYMDGDDLFVFNDKINVLPFWYFSTGYFPTGEQDKYPCPSISQQYPQFIYSAGYYLRSPENRTAMELDTCVGVICSPITWISKVQVIDDGIIPKLTLLSDQTTMSIESNLWDTMIKNVPSGFQPDSGSIAEVNGPVQMVFELQGESIQGIETFNTSLYRNEVLKQAILDLAKQLGPMVAHYQLRQESKSNIVGSVLFESDRLQINIGVCSSIIGLYIIASFIVVWALVQSKSSSFIVWYRDPATVLGSIIFFKLKSLGQKNIPNSLSDQTKKRYEKWTDSNYSPVVLRFWTRFIFTAYVLALIVGLLVSLQESQRSEGLSTIKEDGYSILLWKSSLALAMLIVSLFINSTDTEIRDLAILAKLSNKSCTIAELDTSPLNMVGLRSLLYSYRLRFPAMAVSQILAIFCAFLTTISSLLFTSERIPQLTHTEFQQKSWFGSRPFQNNTVYSQMSLREDLSSLVLASKASNLTYPENTYADLIFPSLDTSGVFRDSETSLNITTQATKLYPNCVQLEDGDYTVINKTILNVTTIQVERSFTCPNGSIHKVSNDLFKIWKLGEDKVTTFGENIESPENLEHLNEPCDLDLGDEAIQNTTWAMRTYVWGTHTGKIVNYITAWKCNYSWYEVSTNFSLVRSNGQVLIDHNNPPIIDGTDIRPWSPPLRVPPLKIKGHTPESGNPFPILGRFDYKEESVRVNMSDEFELTMVPLGTIGADDFSDSRHDEKILKALNDNVALIGAQIANQELRLYFDDQSVAHTSTRPKEPPLVKGIIINSKRYRLIQDQEVTIALVAILSLVLAVNAWALISGCLQRRSSGHWKWLLDLEFKGLAPDCFNSIGMIESILRSTNALQIIPDNAHLMSLQDLEIGLGERKFKMGWFSRAGPEDKKFTIGLLDDEDFQPVKYSKTSS